MSLGNRTKLNSGGFSERSRKTDLLVEAIEKNVLTPDKYFQIRTGIEHRFGKNAAKVHDILYRSMGPTTDLLRYFPDSLFLDRFRMWPTWETSIRSPQRLQAQASTEQTGLFSFYVEYKFSDSERKAALKNVPTKFIGIIEREAWLTYKRLTSPNPEMGLYLDGQCTKIALCYAALYAPDVIYAGWEDQIVPIDDERAIRKDIAKPNLRSVRSSTGSGTPWINFDIRTLKPLDRFLIEELFWDEADAKVAFDDAKATILR